MPTRRAGNETKDSALGIVGVCFIALAIYIAYEAASDLIGRKAPEHSIPGIVLACVSLHGRDQRLTALGRY
jgi:divalent metal cation (Fe/Co/Zn/Cd) transporter